MSRIIHVCYIVIALSYATAYAASRDAAGKRSVRPLAVSAETGKKMAKYSLAAYENGDPTNRVKALLFTPKPMGTSALPMDGGNGNRNLKGDMVCCVLNAVRAND